MVLALEVLCGYCVQVCLIAQVDRWQKEMSRMSDWTTVSDVPKTV